MQWLRRLILKIMKPFNHCIGFIYLSWSHKKFTHRMVSEIEEIIKPGHILITRTEGELTNFFIPGFWSHAAIYVGRGKIVEAIGKGVSLTDLYDFLMSKDYAAVLEPTFASQDHMETACAWALEIIGKPYDYDFEPNDDEYYCAELVAWCYDQAFGGQSPFVPRKTLGVETVTPQDYFDAKEKFKQLWCFKEY